jgi:tetratricopeptide (TPR) repeat protein
VKIFKNSLIPEKEFVETKINRFEFYGTSAIHIPEHDETAEAIKSKNGKYILAWLDAIVFEDGFHMGDRKSGKGNVFFITDEMVKISFPFFERPYFGKVANSGIFSIVDITFTHKHNFVYIINPFLRIFIFKIEIEANILDQWLSDDGRYCAIQCANAYSEDKYKFIFLDLKFQKIILYKELLSVKNHGFPGNLEFHLPDKFSLCYRYGRFEFYIENGELVDENYFHEMEINYLEERLTLCSLNDYQAKINRKIGEIYEKQQKIKEAIQYYKKALNYNPNVGVKMKLVRLIKNYNFPEHHLSSIESTDRKKATEFRSKKLLKYEKRTIYQTLISLVQRIFTP